MIGTQILLDCCREAKVARFLQVSTDEVYGSLGAEGLFTEETPIAPNSPYSASKASADLLVRAYFHTFGFPAVITRCSNNYGPYQFPEKIIPLFISRALDDTPLPVYGKGENVRDWIHVLDHCRGIDAALRQGKPGEVYNFGGHEEIRNIDLTRMLLELLGKPQTLIEFVSDRPGHDLRYAIDCSKAERELGWKPQVAFRQGIRDTIDWYKSNAAWVNRIKTGDYLKYYEQQYGQRHRKSAGGLIPDSLLPALPRAVSLVVWSHRIGGAGASVQLSWRGQRGNNPVESKIRSIRRSMLFDSSSAEARCRSRGPATGTRPWERLT